jgi:phosphate transport system protein
MTKHFHRDLENLQQEILSLSSLVEDMIDSAGRCLFEPSPERAREVIEADKQVDQREVAIEEECLKMLALHQPVAIDLRRIAVVLKINHDLERIGDLAVNIVQRADRLHQRPDFRIPAKLERMSRLATSMMRGTLNAFMDSDTDAAREICLRDDEVDDINREIIEQLIALMKQQPAMVEPAMQCFSVTRHIERIADHATNIAEDVIYLVQGEIVRHRGRPHADGVPTDPGMTTRACPRS